MITGVAPPGKLDQVDGQQSLPTRVTEEGGDFQRKETKGVGEAISRRFSRRVSLSAGGCRAFNLADDLLEK